ncbi:hypothetical protein A0257_03540 [Hymenobacter psoromatis]|nr:hypothetical protein A0257_03540 [Hymenobacter psoromatis]
MPNPTDRPPAGHAAASRPELFRPNPTPRFFLLLVLGLVAACAGYAALVLGSASWPDLMALRGFESINLHPRGPATNGWIANNFTEAGFRQLRLGLAGLALATGLPAALLAAAPAGHRELRQLAAEARGAARGLGNGWGGLRRGQKWLAGAGLLALTAVRVYYSHALQPHDDATSYELFVRHSWLVVNAVYPYPNNHVLSSALDWFFYQVHPNFWWSMRLPVLLVSTATTVGWFLALVRRSSFVVALVAVSWFGLHFIGIYNAALGRGYWLQSGLGGVGFFALLTLQPPLALPAPGPVARYRLAWLGLVASGILGLYTIPTHLFFLASAYGWLGLRAVGQRAGRRLLLLLGAGLLTVVGAGLLYAPLLLVSGPAQLLHNQYVRTLTFREFWQTLPEAVLLPHVLVSLPPVFAILAGFGWLWRRANVGRLPARPARAVLELGLPALWFMLLPYVVAVVALVQPPERTFFYKVQYLFILLGLLVEWAVRQVATSRARRGVGLAFGGLTALYVGGQCWQVERQEHILRQGFHWQDGAPVVAWLAGQPAGPILAPDLEKQFLVRFYAHASYHDRPWQVDSQPRPGVRYRYLVLPAGSPPALGGRVVFRTVLLEVLALP